LRASQVPKEVCRLRRINVGISADHDFKDHLYCAEGIVTSGIHTNQLPLVPCFATTTGVRLPEYLLDGKLTAVMETENVEKARSLSHQLAAVSDAGLVQKDSGQMLAWRVRNCIVRYEWSRKRSI